MLREDLRKARHNGDLAHGQQPSCEYYLAEDWTMSEDAGYMSDNLDWSCGSGSTSSARSSSASSWMGLTSMIVGLLALGTAIYAAFAPRNVIERNADKVRRAVSRGTEQAKTKAEQVMEGVSTAVSSHAAGAGSPSGVGMAGVPSGSRSR